jgi:hypothetical protein
VDGVTPGIDIDLWWSATLAGELVGLSPAERLNAGRDMADRIGSVLAAIESGTIDATETQRARLQGAVVTLTG